MTYTNGQQSPGPTASEREFASLTDKEREAMAREWLRNKVGPQQAGRIYKSTEEPKL